VTVFKEAYMRRVLSFFIGATIGGLVGAVMGLIFAPSSGKQLRAQISDRAQSFASDVRQAASTKRIELQERLEVLRAPRP
jgi:gas vesicle protein